MTRPGQAFTRAIAFACFAVAGCHGSAAPDGVKAERILLIVVDTLRRDALSCYGGPVSTPTLDALAESGQRFPNAIASFPSTAMSMGAIFTGRTPSIESGRGDGTIGVTGRTWCGMVRFRGSNRVRNCIPTSVATLAEVLRGAGYWTMGVASNSILFEPFGIERGFDDWVEVGESFLARGDTTLERLAEVGRSRSAPFVNGAVAEALARRPTDSFFLYVHYMEAHDYRADLAGDPAALAKLEPLYQKYWGRISRVDDAVAALLEQLEAEDLLDGMVIVFTSDHGERLGELHMVRGDFSHKGNPAFEELLRVPLIVSPARFSDTTRLVRGQDIFGLVARIAGVNVDVPPEVERDEVFVTETDWRVYRRGPWKSYSKRGEDTLLLVDLSADAGETTDVSAANPEVAETHRRRMAALGQSLGVSNAAPARLTPEDEGRLRALGYLE
jgi:arylsulfatase A-like enzyme